MRVVRNRPEQVAAQPVCSGRSVVAIGNFDGVHLGHQALLKRCRELMQDGDELAVVTFEPLPHAWFNPENDVARLSTTYHKLALFREFGVDLTWLMRFDDQLASLSDVHFGKRVLADGLRARAVVVGEDFRFGRGRNGDVESLRELGRGMGYEAHAVPTVQHEGERISSSAVREALARGRFERATALLGRPYTMEGKVMPGRQLGRNLGFPTANLRIRALPCPLRGIYAVRAKVDGQWLPGVANLGRRPAVGGEELLLEVHIFDFNETIYGQRLEVEFVEKLRDEAHFIDLADLVDQMCRDADEARQILGLK